jgi:RNase H-fold protein (predicted Holliday junction resolvase)
LALTATPCTRPLIDGKNTGIQGFQKQIKGFAEALERRFEVPVRFEKEFMTSFEAHGRQGKEVNNARQTKFAAPDNLDARAAALILQRYLDKQNKK